MQLRGTYREGGDLLAYAELNAPDFPPEDQMDCPRFFERLSRCYGILLENETNEVALQWLRLSKQEIAKAKTLFLERKNDDALGKLTCAREYLVNAMRRKSMKPKFLTDDTGFSE
jgi:hypothetical protein